MELTKNIFFNTDKLVANTTVKISYIGNLYQNASEEVFIHYGFGNNWDNINDIQMKKTDLGFQAEIDLLEGDSFNFCFKDSNDNWDNNDNQNYSFPLEKVQTELLVLEDEPVSLGSVRKLRRSYLWSKKVRLAVYKLITYLPKILSGNYKRKISNTND
jgi:hypothetical protein